ncbi:MAG: TIGR04282 family arsenosugar biosynthesis glycosyltransferase [Candidatus Krumholzibacteria bacterium]|nr:TIGR04282 family arsenosugar biosynthesis glycosyltransferase [Candidatus Krumholzibacteria bacterium]
MSSFRKLGIFVRIPEPGRVKTRLVPPLSAEGACDLYDAFLRDLFARVDKLKKVAVTVFYSGDTPDALRAFAPKRFRLEAQKGQGLGERLHNAFGHLLDSDRSMAVVIGSDSPDLPLTFIKRAFLKLKHKDIVLGPTSDGGYYLIGLKKLLPAVLENITWGTASVLEETLERVREHSLSCSLLPLWYDVDDVHSLALLRTMLLGRRIERSDRLWRTERIMEEIFLHDTTNP